MLRNTSKKSTKKAQPRKKTNTSNKSKGQVKEEEVVLNDIMEPEDIEAEIILNDLVPERDKSKYGIKSNNTKQKKGGLKLNLNFMSNSKKSNKTSKTTKTQNNRSSENNIEEPDTENTNDDLKKTQE